MSKTSSSKQPRRELRKQLQAAISAGDPQRVRAIAAADATIVNASNAHHNVPLGDAIKSGNLAMVELLIALGADPCSVNHGGRSLLDAAALLGDQPDIARCLIAAGATPSILHAAALGDIPTLQQSLQEDPTRLSAQPCGGRWELSPLHAAAMTGCMESIECLLQAGAAVDEPNHNQHTPLALAVEQLADARAAAVARVLLAAGALPDGPAGHHGGSLLHRAVMLGKCETAEALLKGGANPNLQDWSEKTPLHYAVEKNLALVQLLLQFNPDLTLTSVEDETPADLARRKGKRSVVQLLESAAG